MVVDEVRIRVSTRRECQVSSAAHVIGDRGLRERTSRRKSQREVNSQKKGLATVVASPCSLNGTPARTRTWDRRIRKPTDNKRERRPCTRRLFAVHTTHRVDRPELEDRRPGATGASLNRFRIGTPSAQLLARPNSIPKVKARKSWTHGLLYLVGATGFEPTTF